MNRARNKVASYDKVTLCEHERDKKKEIQKNSEYRNSSGERDRKRDSKRD